MSTLICMRMWGPRGLTSISTNVCRLLPNTSSVLFPSNLQLQTPNYAALPQNASARNFSISVTRLKEVFKRDKPHLNIGNIF